MPRFGTVERLATQLAKIGDSRCWDVLQAGEDHASDVEGWQAKGKWVRKNVEEAWEKARSSGGEEGASDVEVVKIDTGVEPERGQTAPLSASA